jgi:hypothetical protein
MIMLQGKHIWLTPNKRKDDSGGYFGYVVKRKDTDKLARNSNIILCRCSNVT